MVMRRSISVAVGLAVMSLVVVICNALYSGGFRGSALQDHVAIIAVISAYTTVLWIAKRRHDAHSTLRRTAS